MSKQNKTIKTDVNTEVEKAMKDVCGSPILEMVINNVPQHIFWKDTNSIFIGCNENFAHALGLESPEDIKGLTDYDLVDREKADHFIRMDKSVLNANQPVYNLVEQHKNSNGEIVWISINKIPLRNNKGETIGILGTFEDITDRFKMERKLKKSEEKYRSLIDFSNTSYAILDTKMRIVEANNNFLRLLDSPSMNFVLNSNLRSWVFSKDIEAFDDAFQKIRDGGNAIEDLEINLINDKGDSVYVAMTANIIENGETRIFCLIRNISHRKEAMTRQYIQRQKKKDRLVQHLKEIRNEIRERLG